MLIKLKAATYLAKSFREYRKDDLVLSRLFLDKHFSLCKHKSATALAFSATLYFWKGI